MNKMVPHVRRDVSLDLDFWLGEWNLTWSDGGSGRNRIFRTMRDKIIEEEFLDVKSGYTGRSWSVCDESSGIWKQTWVDSDGAYLHFTGGREGDRMVFRTRKYGPSLDRELPYEMIFKDIKEDGFVWIWRFSVDEGVTWIDQWVIQYTRVIDSDEPLVRGKCDDSERVRSLV